MFVHRKLDLRFFKLWLVIFQLIYVFSDSLFTAFLISLRKSFEYTTQCMLDDLCGKNIKCAGRSHDT